MEIKKINYNLLSINAGIISAIFIFFSVAAMAANFTIFDFNGSGCSYGFHLEPQEAQIAVTVSVGILLIPFAISSVIILLGHKMANFMTSLGFALIIATSLMIIASLSCRIPSGFLSNVMIIPALATVGIISVIFLLKKKFGSSDFSEKKDDLSLLKFKKN